MNKIIVCLLAFICLLPFWDFTLSIENYISFLPFVLYAIFIINFKKCIFNKNMYKQEKVKECVLLTDIYKAFFFNFLFFVLFVFFFAIIVKLLEKFFSKNVLLFIFYVWFIQNAAIKSPGFAICKIDIDTTSIKKIISLFLFNIYKYSLFIYGLLSKDFRESQTGISIGSIIIIFYGINVFYRFFISKEKSLVEHILNIKYTKITT